MRKVLQQLKQYKRNTFLCIGLTALEVIMEILIPFITAIIIDRGLEAGNLPVVYRYGALMVFMAFLSLTFAAAAGKNAAAAEPDFQLYHVYDHQPAPELDVPDCRGVSGNRDRFHHGHYAEDFQSGFPKI